MNPVRQKDGLGCAVACMAFVLQLPYEKALRLFVDGETRVKGKTNFYCPELVKILNRSGQHYSWKKLKTPTAQFSNLSIVFIKRSKKYPHGHFVCKYKNAWMDPWINLPQTPTKAGLREKLPEEPTYVIYKIGSSKHWEH